MIFFLHQLYNCLSSSTWGVNFGTMLV